MQFDSKLTDFMHISKLLFYINDGLVFMLLFKTCILSDIF